MPQKQTKQLEGRALVRFLANRAALICLVLGAFVGFISLTPLGANLFLSVENPLYDQFFAWRGVNGAAHAAMKDVVLVTIDDESVRALGAYPPLPRQLYSYLCRALEDAGADVIGFQTVFDGASPAFSGKGNDKVSPRLADYVRETFNRECITSADADDSLFTDELARHKNIVLASQIEMGPNLTQIANFKFMTPYEPFVKAAGGESALGNASLQADSDGLIRHVFINAGSLPRLGGSNTSFSARLLEKRLHATATASGDQLRIRGMSFPRRFRINYAGPAETFQTVPLWKALEWRKYYYPVRGSDSEEQLLPNPFSHKIVIIGYQDLSPVNNTVLENVLPPESIAAHSALLFNSFQTPMGRSGKPMSGAEIQANIVANLLGRNGLTEMPLGAQCFLYIGIAGLLGLIYSAINDRGWLISCVVVGLAFGWLCLSYVMFVQAHHVIPGVVPAFLMLASLACVLFDEKIILRRMRRMQTRIFRRVASRKLAEQIDKQQLVALGLSGKSAEITCLVCDVYNLGSLLEGLPADEGIDITNDCMTAIRECIIECGGIIERALNHGIVAVWGAPIEMAASEQALAAAQAARKIEKRLCALPAQWLARGLTTKDSAPSAVIGINTGVAICGVVGNRDDALYTAVGNSIDEGYQLMSANRTFATSCLVGANTAQYLLDQFEVRKLDAADLNVADAPATIYQLLSEKGSLSGVLEESATLYEQALSRLVDGDVNGARTLLESALSVNPEDVPARLALARCRRAQGQAELIYSSQD